MYLILKDYPYTYQTCQLLNNHTFKIGCIFDSWELLYHSVNCLLMNFSTKVNLFESIQLLGQWRLFPFNMPFFQLENFLQAILPIRRKVSFLYHINLRGPHNAENATFLRIGFCLFKHKEKFWSRGC